MAASRGAHIATIQQGSSNTDQNDETIEDVAQPSIFDVLSQESLMSGLKPAVGHLIKVKQK